MPKSAFPRLLVFLVVIFSLLVIFRNLYYRYVNSGLSAAVRAKDVTRVRTFLEHGADANYQRPLGSLLSSPGVMTQQEQDIACLLIEHGSEIGEYPRGFPSYLETACRDGALPVVRVLLRHGANANFVNPTRSTPMDATVEYILIDHSNPRLTYDSQGSVLTGERAKDYTRRLGIGKEIIHLLQEHSARLSPWQAIQIGDIAALRAAVDSGIDLEATEPVHSVSRSRKEPTLLQMAAYSGNMEAIRLLVAHGANVNVTHSAMREETPLMLAIISRHEEAARFLVAHGADVNSQPRGAVSPFLVAINRLPTLVPYLLQHGADLKEQGIPALCEAIRRQQPELVALLFKKGVRCTGPAGYEALAAALEYRPDLIPVMLSQGANAREMPQETRSLLWEAVRNDREEWIEPLLRAGANIHAKHDKITLLMEAIGHKPSLFKLLLDKGADPNPVIDSNPSVLIPTPLIAAAQAGNIENTRLLLHYGAKVDGRGNFAHTPLYYARKRHHTEVADLLQKAGGTDE